MPFKQHPVPQHMASYEFRLIGDMTIKQFGWLASGVLIALLFYSLPIYSFIKWPLVFVSGFLGFAFAFMPIEERPLSVWLTAFFKSVFSPTFFLWQKKLRRPEIFEPLIHTQALPARLPSLPADKEQLEKYLRTLPSTQFQTSLDEKESGFLKQIAGLFQIPQETSSYTAPAPLPIISRPVIKPIIKAVPPPPAPPPPSSPAPKPKRVFRPRLEPELEPLIFPAEPPRRPSVQAKYGPHLPMPAIPAHPNILAGMVLDKLGDIIEGAILEIRNKDNMPVRALKTNKLGQFTIATPLENGIYELEIEKEGYQFDIIKLETKGEIIKPIEIRAK